MAIKVSGTEVISDDKRILNNESLPDIRPSLLLDFANSKTLDPRITFTRGSTATYWDGKTTAKAEENLLKYSQELDTSSYWNPVRLDITGDAATAPDGTTTATQLDQASGETTGGRIAAISGNNPISSGNEYTFSVYAKPNGKGFLRVNFSNDQMYYNISSGALGTTPSSVTASIEDAGNGWYRCIGTWTAGNSNPLYMHVADTDNSQTVTDDQQGIYLWGAQIEQRSSATAYTPTTTAPIVKYQPVLQTAASGEARFDHDPVTGESKGLLIEEARTNLSANSVPVSGWSVNPDIKLMGYEVAPDGTIAAPYYMQLGTGSDASNNNADIPISASSSTNYCISCFVKKAPDGHNKAVFYNFFLGNSTKGSRFEYTFSTDTLAAYEADGGGVVPFNYGREFVGNGWVRIWYVVNDANNGLNDTLGTRFYAGNRDVINYQGLIVWGFQVEEGSFPTSYIPTSGSTVTRSHDNAAITSSNLDWYSGTGGTVFCDAVMNVVYGTSSKFPRFFEFRSSDGGTSNESIRIIAGVLSAYTDHRTSVVSDGSAVFSSNTDSETNGQLMALAFETDNYAVSIGGTSPTTDTSGRLTSNIDQLNLGNYANASSSTSNLHMKKFAYYPKRLPNATLQAMTEE